MPFHPAGTFLPIGVCGKQIYSGQNKVTTSIECGCRAARYHSVSSIQMGMYSWFSVKSGYLQACDFIVLFSIGRNLKQTGKPLYSLN